jgi:hypothetical protein
MPMSSSKEDPMPQTSRLGPVLVLGTILTGGCDVAGLFGELEQSRTLVNVSVTHHASVEQGMFPDRGGEGETRTFETDEGWTVSLTSAYFTTASVTLHRCGGDAVALDMYWGPLAEDITLRDLDMLTVGGVEVDATEFCAVDVDYGPYPETSRMAGLEPEIAGASFYLAGFATKGELAVPFEVRSSEAFGATLDLSTIADGRPLEIHGGEDFPVELAVSKTYDRVFDGVDFESASSDELADQVAAVLALESRVSLDRVTP